MVINPSFDLVEIYKMKIFLGKQTAVITGETVLGDTHWILGTDEGIS